MLASPTERPTLITIAASLDTHTKGFEKAGLDNVTSVKIPKQFNKSINGCQQQLRKKGFKRRAAIEPKISHMKEGQCLGGNYYNPIKGVNNSVMLAEAAMKFKSMMNYYK